MQNKFSLVPTYLCSIAFSWLNMALPGLKMVRKIYKQIILYTFREKRKGKKIDQKIKSCLCSFYIEYNLNNAYQNAELIKLIFPLSKNRNTRVHQQVHQWGTPCFKIRRVYMRGTHVLFFKILHARQSKISTKLLPCTKP